MGGPAPPAASGGGRRSLPAATAGSGGDDRPPAAAGTSPLLGLVASPAYQWAQAGVVLLLLMLVDAGFSRDWSRIGVLTGEQEDQLQSVAAAIGAFHLLCAVPAAAVSAMRGEAWAPRTAKVLAVGGLALLEVLLLPARGGEAERQRW